MAKIKIIKCTAFNPEFDNLIPNSVHEVLTEDECSVWVMGKTEPVRLMDYEYEWLDDE